jgi:large subunit ribosomal protein L24
MVKRHSKPSQTNQQGGIIEKEGTIAIANVALWDDKAGKGVRSKAGSDNGKKVRVSVKTGTKFVVNP